MNASTKFQLSQNSGLDYLRGVFTWSNIVIFSILFSSLILILFPFVYFVDKNRHSLHAIANIWAKCIQFCNPWWTFIIQGKENLAQKNEVVVYVANHQSQADILALFILSIRFRWLSKSSLFKIPFLGWGMSAIGYVPVNRSSKSSSKQSIKLSTHHLSQGISMIFFPEGTRSKNGELGEFKMGAFRLAKTNQVPIIPITIKGCANMLPKGTIWPKVTKVNITIHPKIVTTNLTPNEIMIEAREKISSKLIGS